MLPSLLCVLQPAFKEWLCPRSARLGAEHALDVDEPLMPDVDVADGSRVRAARTMRRGCMGSAGAAAATGATPGWCACRQLLLLLLLPSKEILLLFVGVLAVATGQGRCLLVC